MIYGLKDMEGNWILDNEGIIKDCSDYFGRN